MARLVLHIGQAKTGTTSLQKLFRAQRQQLLERGVLYPALPENFNHARLVPHLLGTDGVRERIVSQLGDDPASALRRSGELWREVERQCEANELDAIVLSSESLFRIVPEASRVHYAAAIRGLGEAVSVVAYVRDPVSHFLSWAQQNTKHKGEIQLPADRASVEDVVKSHDATLGRVHLRPFERGQLRDGSVVIDFASRFVPEAEDVVRAAGDRDRKATLSAEAMAILQDCNRASGAGGRRLRALKAIDRAFSGFTRPRLHSDVADAILRQDHSLQWLREERDLVFDGVDYTIAGSGGGKVLRPDPDVDEICAVDVERKAALLAEVRAHERWEFLRRLRSRALRPFGLAPAGS